MDTCLHGHRFACVIVIACLVLVAPVFAADETESDVILLKNGNTIRGTITEKVAGEKFVIQRADGEVFEVPTDKIFAVTNDAQLEQRRSELKMLQPQRRIYEWENVTLAGFYSGEGEKLFSASTVNGAWMSDRLFIGLGVGWDNYPGGNVVPLFAEAKYYYSWKSLRPFIFTDAGYSFGWLDGINGANYGGLHLNIGMGTKLFADAHGAIPLVQAGFRLQQTKKHSSDGARESVTYTFITVMAGIAF